MPEPNALLALDIGGANLKAADGQGFALSHSFALWKSPNRLAEALMGLLQKAPPAKALVATMTGELADCYLTKADGVRAILRALSEVAAGRPLSVYLTDGEFVSAAEAAERPLAAASSNWRAVAQFSARYLPDGNGLLIDIGGTTCDVIPIADGIPATAGLTDPDRLASGELIYTGVVRSPVCAVAAAIPWRGAQCPTAHELFATTQDAYLTLGDLSEDASDTATADGRPATREAARDRLARSICADREMFSDADALAAADAIRTSQAAKLAIPIRSVIGRMAVKPTTVVLSGQGEFLARRVLERLRMELQLVSLAEKLGPDVSRCAPAHALAVLAMEAGR